MAVITRWALPSCVRRIADAWPHCPNTPIWSPVPHARGATRAPGDLLHCPLATRHYPDPALLASIRQQLTQRDGVPITDVLAEIARRGPVSVPIATPTSPTDHTSPTSRTFDLTPEVAIG